MWEKFRIFLSPPPTVCLVVKYIWIQSHAHEKEEINCWSLPHELSFDQQIALPSPKEMIVVVVFSLWERPPVDWFKMLKCFSTLVTGAWGNHEAQQAIIHSHCWPHWREAVRKHICQFLAKKYICPMVMNKVWQGNFYFLQGFLNLLRGVFQLMWSSLTPPPLCPFRRILLFYPDLFDPSLPEQLPFLH